jgi:RNA polymerase sigma-70 factor (ECF subfamily)
VDAVTRLAVAARDGDRTALSRLVRATQADVWRLCAHLASPGEADDLAQETYLRALGSLPGFRAESSARTWLLAIARRVAADHHRRALRRRSAEASAGPPVEAAVLELHQVLSAALRTLDTDRHVAFVLTQVLGLGYAEAAEVCGCPIGTIRSRVARARADLVTFLEDEGGARAASAG